ncbi:ABC transporter A family member 7-like isoform X1 [Cynara cardunculus var. scolymus]|uniref:ABC transporter A family member 7-like isoform X1 n=1 Tax=Cynara cardunculus var. scolymus TaxID=59895 RepID=UPI000D6309A9|nr:ABC transporter A family member 7-like isoform X1 [Cynara cardunculus var. scolymus]
MAESTNGSSSFWTQANALFRKNLTFQRRNFKTNLRLIAFPIVLCLLLVLLQAIVNNELDKPSNKCGCTCIDQDGDGQCERVCGIQYSDLDQVATCSIPSPPEWPPILQLPAPQYRAVRTDFLSFGDLPGDSCRSTGSCPTTVLMTGNNQSLGESLARNMFPSSSNFSSSNGLTGAILGSASETDIINYLEPAFFSSLPLYYVQSQCGANSTFSIPIPVAFLEVEKEIRCVQALHLWRNSSSDVNNELYAGYRKGNSEDKINEILAAYDLSNSNINNFNVTVWYNSTYKNDTGNGPSGLVRVPRSINLVSNAYLQLLVGPSTQMLFDFVKETPKPETEIRLDFSSLLGPLFFTWVILQLFPIVLTALVYEKQQNLRIMMKMHGLGDGPYWMISYTYFLAISLVYMFCFVVFGSVVGLKFFTLNDYSIQFVFYVIYVNLQISLAFLVAALFSNVKTAAVVGYITVFGTGLLGGFFFQFFLQDTSFPRAWIVVMELYPGFSLYAGLYEFSQYAFTGNYMGTRGMSWENLSDSNNEMARVLVIMVVEWLVVFVVAYYIDQVVTSGSGVRKGPLFFLEKLKRKPSPSFRKPSLHRQGSKVYVQLEKPDVSQERERVEQLLIEQDTSHAVVCDNLKKMYPGRDGNPEKFAVRGLSLALSQGECFGMLGPNGAGKTSFINMMIGLIKPSSGTAYVRGLDIRTNMDGIYANMGVCPQHDLLWETLTGREHLLFYGRLKNLKGIALTQAVEESLRSVNLFNGGVADKQSGKYSGGMKRRLSVAISLIGDPKVVYMDEPSTGLDPASRNNLWNVVKQAKQNRAIILTTHSMEEAEHLCDRLGIFVDGSLQCIGNPKELKGRYGGSYVFTMTTSSDHETDVENLVKSLSPKANKIYQISGTQKFELPKEDIKIADVFGAVEKAKSRFSVQAWGLADTTLEDVFIKVAREAQPLDVLT